MKNAVSVSVTLFLTAVFLVFLIKPALFNPPSINPDHEFDTARAFQRLERILGDEQPHPVDTDSQDVLLERLSAEIEALGFAPLIRDEFICDAAYGRVNCARIRNILFWVGEPGPDAILLASHHDSVPASPGAVDDGIGLAVSLEVAAILAEAPAERPVLVLMTDAEEMGLLGARAFVAQDPLADLVSSVINIDARGVSGQAVMFQTSQPNGHAVLSLASTARHPIATSLSANVYDMLPNDTDATAFLDLDVDLANFAVIDGDYYYHTPRDNLANLDRRSLFHMGASAIGAVRGFDRVTGEAEGQWAYTDIVGLFILKLPEKVAIGMIILGGVLCASGFVRAGGGAPIRTALLPVSALVLATACAFLPTSLIDLIRSDEAFAFANPWALRGFQLAVSLFATLACFKALLRTSDPLRALAAAWTWIAILAAMLSLFMPGGSILFAPSLALAGLGSLCVWFRASVIAKVLFVLAGSVLLILLLPLAHFAELALKIDAAAPIVIIPIMLVLVLLPFLIPRPVGGLKTYSLPLAVLFSLTIGFGAASFLVPAYSAEAPRRLNILHAQEAGEEPQWSFRTAEQLPAEFSEIAPFRRGQLTRLGGERYLAPAPPFEEGVIGARVEEDRIEGDGRTVRFAIQADRADQVIVRPGNGFPDASEVEVNGFQLRLSENWDISCFGRACRQLDINLSLPASGDELDFDVLIFRYGLGPESQTLLEARPEHTIASQLGDIRLSTRRLTTSPET